MKPKIATARAVGAYLASQSLKFVSIIFVGLVIALLIAIGLLAYNFTAWWWILALPIALISLVFAGLYWVIRRLITAIYRHPYSRDQRQALDDFTDKVRGLVEARSTPLPIFALITLKDILIHRDPRSIRKLIEDSTSLKSDYKNLEKHFGER